MCVNFSSDKKQRSFGVLFPRHLRSLSILPLPNTRPNHEIRVPIRHKGGIITDRIGSHKGPTQSPIPLAIILISVASSGVAFSPRWLWVQFLFYFLSLVTRIANNSNERDPEMGRELERRVTAPLFDLFTTPLSVLRGILVKTARRENTTRNLRRASFIN